MAKAWDGGPLPRYLNTVYQAQDLEGTLREPSRYVQETIDGRNGQSLTGTQWEQLIDYTKLPKYQYRNRQGRPAELSFEPWALYNLVPAMSASHQVAKKYAEVYRRYLAWFKTKYAPLTPLRPKEKASSVTKSVAVNLTPLKPLSVAQGKPSASKRQAQSKSVATKSLAKSKVGKLSESKSSAKPVSSAVNSSSSHVASMASASPVSSSSVSEQSATVSVNMNAVADDMFNFDDDHEATSSVIAKEDVSSISSNDSTTKVSDTLSSKIVSNVDDAESASFMDVEDLASGPVEVVDTADNGQDRYDLMANLNLIPTTALANGDVRVSYNLKSKHQARVRMLPSLIFLQRQELLDLFKDHIAQELIEKLSYGDVVQTMALIYAVKSRDIRRRDFQRYCLAIAIMNLSFNGIEKLRTAPSLNAIINGQLDLLVSVHLRWFLYLSKHLIGQTADRASEVDQKLDQIINDLDLLRGLHAADLATFDENEWDDLLYGQTTKRASRKIDEAYDGLVKPIQTRRRTRQVQRKFKRK